ncbi:MAG: ThuA domain-containing protein [Planctomycetota bacterium]
MAADQGEAESPEGAIKVMIVTGQNNHQWTHDSPALKAILDADGRFHTDIMVSPHEKDAERAEKWEAFRPDFSQYDVVLVNYNSQGGGREDWPEPVKDDFVAYISGGGKAYVFHAGNNSFPGWDEYYQMVGLLWRGRNAGKRVYLDDAGEVVTEPAGQGRGAGHGRKYSYVVTNRAPDHPIFAGLPVKWMHNNDELYHGQRGPAENMTILATAYDEPDQRGTGKHELVIWTIPYGEGLVLTNVMGHWMGKEGPALDCVGFQVVLVRSIEFLATGEVTTPVPDNFPTQDAVSLNKLEFEPIASDHQHLHFAHTECCPHAAPEHLATGE